MFSGFMTNTWIVASIVAVIAGVVGVFVVMRGDSFAAHAIPNGAFAGAAGASLLGLSTLGGLAVFAVAGSLGIGLLGRRGRTDVATALTLTFMLALGATFLSHTSEYSPEIFALLFGQELGVSTTQILPVVLLAVACLVAILFLYRPLLLSSSVPEVAEARGIRVHRLELVFLVVVGLSTAMTVPVVGALLIFSLMIGPAAAGRAFAKQPSAGIAISVALALVTAWLAIASSYLTNWPIGFFVGAYSAVVYLLGRVWTVVELSRPGRHVPPLQLARVGSHEVGPRDGGLEG